MNPTALLKKHFRFDTFKPGQEEVIKSILDGKDTVALMPTGGGKSLCYQLPALEMEGTTIIVSPLIALMKNQVDALTARGIPATFINSSIDSKEGRVRMQKFEKGEYKIVYIAPERLDNPEFLNILAKVYVPFFAIDEAHCVSSWGHDFRPDYMNLHEHISKFKKRPIVAAFTATATPEVKEDIIKRLELKKPQTYVYGFDRPNLRFFVRDNLSDTKRKEETVRIVKSLPGSGIVYVRTIKEAEEISQLLKDSGISSYPYHASLNEKRAHIQDEFMENKFKVIVATIAFGMGVDKADIRFVIHMGMPDSLESYYQEAGRAGRDGELSYCVLLHSGKDNSIHHFFIMKSKSQMKKQGKSWEEVQQITSMKYDKFHTILNFVEGKVCRRKAILEYFSDPSASSFVDGCKGCDICLNYSWSEDEIGNGKSKNKKQKGERGTITTTQMETVTLYQVNHSVEQIAKIRNLGQSTIVGHLIKWYLSGGDLPIDTLITPEEEKQILAAMSKADDYLHLRPIKELLPEEISYEKIRLVFAKIAKAVHST